MSTSTSRYAGDVNGLDEARAPGVLGRRAVDLAARLSELLRLLLEPLHERRGLLGDTVGGGVVAHVLRDLHRAEVRPAHRAEVGELGALGRQGLVVELARRLRIEREVELVLPAKLEARLTERVVPLALSKARFEFRWEDQFNLSLDPETAR